jgi:hypothetical protein
MRNQSYRSSSILISALLLTVTACLYGTGTAPSPPRGSDPDGAVWLNVTNNSGGPMEIYASGSGAYYRIGTVLPGLTDQFVVRPIMIVNGPVEFVARTSGREPAYRSGRLLLVPGNVVDFELKGFPVNSVATVRP